MKIKIELITLTDVKNFVAAASNVNGDVYLVDRNHRYRINAKSTLGCLLAQAEWSEIWVESETDCYSSIKEWVVD